MPSLIAFLLALGTLAPADESKGSKEVPLFKDEEAVRQEITLHMLMAERYFTVREAIEKRERGQPLTEQETKLLLGGSQRKLPPFKKLHPFDLALVLSHGGSSRNDGTEPLAQIFERAEAQAGPFSTEERAYLWIHHAVVLEKEDASKHGKEVAHSLKEAERLIGRSAVRRVRKGYEVFYQGVARAYQGLR